jgi:hypothetical protein
VHIVIGAVEFYVPTGVQQQNIALVDRDAGVFQIRRRDFLTALLFD